MYHYRESGLPNVFLVNGYREVDTDAGVGIAIEDVHGLHLAIARTLVEEKFPLTGPEVRFIRKFLDMTQAELALVLGVDDQSVRRWEKLARIPKQADHGIRLVFRDITHLASLPLPELLRQIEQAENLDASRIRYRYHPRARQRWQPQDARAAA